MKKILLILVASLFAFACGEKASSGDGFVLNGKIDKAADTEILLKKVGDAGIETVDSVIADKEGKFTFKGKVDNPEVYYIKIGREGRNYVPLFIENAVITIEGSLDSLHKIEVSGSASNDEYKKFLDESQKYNEKIQNLSMQYMMAQQSGDTALLKQIEEQYNKIYEEQKAFSKQYVREHGNSHAASYILYSQLSFDMGLDSMKALYNVFSEDVKSGIYGKKIKEMIDIMERTAPGQPIIDFTMNDTAGNPVKLSEYVKDKYVLVDFWAAWCRPCRAENPNVVKLYKKYHDKGFDVLGVSFDDSREAWLGAIKQDGLLWTQVSDLKGWGNEAGKLYGIRAIPHSMLVGPDGKIIAHNLRGEDLANKLAEIFGE